MALLELARQIRALVAQQGRTQAEAAGHAGVTQPHMNDLLRGRLSRSSLDTLVNMAAACETRVDISLRPC